LRAGWNLSTTGANTIFHGFEDKNPSFEKIHDQIPAPRPYIKNSGLIYGRYIVLSLYPNFQLSKCRNGETIEKR
jgi:hypothetical protein